MSQNSGHTPEPATDPVTPAAEDTVPGSVPGTTDSAGSTTGTTDPTEEQGTPATPTSGTQGSSGSEGTSGSDSSAGAESSFGSEGASGADQTAGKGGAEGAQHAVAEGLRTVSEKVGGLAGGEGVVSDLAAKAEAGLKQASSWVADRDPDTMMTEAKSFARRKPWVVAGEAAVALVVLNRITRAITGGSKR